MQQNVTRKTRWLGRERAALSHFLRHRPLFTERACVLFLRCPQYQKAWHWLFLAGLNVPCIIRLLWGPIVTQFLAKLCNSQWRELEHPPKCPVVQFDSTLIQSRSKPHGGQSGKHKIPSDTLWSLYNEVFPVASTLLVYIYSVQGKPKRQGILCRVNFIRCPRGLRPMEFNASQPIVPDNFFAFLCSGTSPENAESTPQRSYFCNGTRKRDNEIFIIIQSVTQVAQLPES